MTEQELIDAGFKKQEANHLETGNGYDYYYYLLDLCEGICLISSDSDAQNKEQEWSVRSFDIPAINIKTKEHLNAFIDLVKTVTNC